MKINSNAYLSLVADFNTLQTKKEVAKFEDQVSNNFHDGRITLSQYNDLDSRITKRLNLNHSEK
jgi:hypothetical protein